MAQFQGKSPEELAAEIIEKMQKPVLIEVSGVAGQNLDLVLRYKFSKKIYSKGEKWFQNNRESLATEWLEAIIESQYQTRKKLDEKQEEADKWEYVNILQSRGFTRYKALEMAGLLSKEDVEAQEKLDKAAADKAAAAVKAGK